MANIFYAFLLLGVLMAVNAQTCPPLGFDSVANLDLGVYISAPWTYKSRKKILLTVFQNIIC
jgi:hypothetical protein